MRLNYEDSEKLEELADEYGLKVSTYCRAILKAHLYDKYLEQDNLLRNCLQLNLRLVTIKKVDLVKKAKGGQLLLID